MTEPGQGCEHPDYPVKQENPPLVERTLKSGSIVKVNGCPLRLRDDTVMLTTPGNWDAFVLDVHEVMGQCCGGRREDCGHYESS